MSIFTLALFYYGGVEKASAEEKSGEFDYTCEASALGQSFDINMNVNPTVNVPESVSANSSLSIEDIDADIQLDLNEANPILQGALNPFTANINSFDLKVNDNSKNVLEDGVAINNVEAEDNIIPFNIAGVNTTFDIGKNDVDINAGEIVAIIDTAVGDVNATCTPQSDNLIATVSVEEEKVDDVAPEITLNGDNPMELEVGETYEEPGATAKDDVDGDVTDDIEISGEVNTDEAGEYELTYTVSDAAGNEATETRTVMVKEEEQEPGDGNDGEDGADGNDGEDGADGNDGEDGADGNDGEDGADGNNGEDGTDGNNGKDGEDGKNGEDGADGNDGEDGADGNDGEDGADGNDGEDGADGKNGEDGADGKDGEDGADGNDGEDGADGNDGEDGADGKNGEDGADGKDGKSIVVEKDKKDDETQTVVSGSDNNSTHKPGTLPNTATDNPLFIALGAGLLIIGGTILVIRRKKLIN